MNSRQLVGVLFWVIIGLSVVSIFTPPPQRWKNSLLLYSTIGVVLMFGVYELLMPSEITIRVDLVYLLPLTGLACLAFLIKVIWYSSQTRVLSKDEGKE
jgi:hypothetical protein